MAIDEDLETAVKNATADGGGSKAAKAPSTPSDAAQGQYVSSLIGTYLSIWGINPPPGYIERVAAGHMNVFEFEAHERSKPAFRHSPRYQEERVGIEEALARWAGAMG